LETALLQVKAFRILNVSWALTLATDWSALADSPAHILPATNCTQPNEPRHRIK